MNQDKKCIECGGLFYAKDRCRAHWMAQWRATRTDWPRCSVKDCVKNATALGLCSLHRTRMAQGKKINAPVIEDYGKYTKYISVCLKEDQLDSLKKKAKKQGVTMSMLLRQALDRLVA
jgi:hypothetical protein